MKRALLACLIAVVASGAGACAAPHPGITAYMKPVNAVLSAMSAHDAPSLDGAYASGAIIVDDQPPYQWSWTRVPALNFSRHTGR